MDLLKLGAQMFIQKMGGSGGGLDIGAVTGALKGLLPTSGDQLDLGAIVQQMQGGGLANMASSWLGDGGNEGISVEQVTSVFGESKLSGFAQQLGLQEGETKEGLASMLPELIDKGSTGGDLLKSVGSGILGKLF